MPPVDSHHANLYFASNVSETVPPVDSNNVPIASEYDDDLRINYSKFLLSLILPASPETVRDRRKYASVVGNIDDDLVSFALAHEVQSLMYK